MDNNLSESKRNLSRAPQETELGSVPVSQWPSLYKKQVRNLEFQLTSVSRGRVRPPLGVTIEVRPGTRVLSWSRRGTLMCLGFLVDFSLVLVDQSLEGDLLETDHAQM